MIQPGTVAAIAGSLMGRTEDLSEGSDILNEIFIKYRKQRVAQFTALALDLCKEAEKQTLNLTKKRS